MARHQVDGVVELSSECIEFSDKSDPVKAGEQIGCGQHNRKLVKLTVANPGKTILR
jgi:hypothetical protein